MREFNFIYSKIVNDENDFIGKIAYSIYKEDKIEFINNFNIKHSKNPDQDELKQFHEIASTVNSISRYRLEAEALLQEFLDNTLTEALAEASEEIKSNQILLIREEVRKLKPAGFWSGVWQNVMATVVLTGILALILLIINFSYDGFWKTFGNLFGYDVVKKK